MAGCTHLVDALLDFGVGRAGAPEAGEELLEAAWIGLPRHARVSAQRPARLLRSERCAAASSGRRGLTTRGRGDGGTERLEAKWIGSGARPHGASGSAGTEKVVVDRWQQSELLDWPAERVRGRARAERARTAPCRRRAPPGDLARSHAKSSHSLTAPAR